MPLLPDGEYRDEPSENPHQKLYVYNEIKIQGIKTFGRQRAKHVAGEIPWHFHRNCFEFHYLLQGSISFVVDHQEYHLKGGEVFVTFPNEFHRSSHQDVMIRKMYWFTVEDSKALLNLDPLWSTYLIQSLHRLKNRIIPVGNEMRQSIEAVFQNIASDEQGPSFYASMQMASFLYQLIEYDRLAQRPSISREIACGLEFIQQNKTRNLALEEVARHCHLSLSHFKRRFKNETGTTPAAYIQRQRMECAKKLLQAGHSVTQTAHELDFSSSNYFSVVFRRHTLMTPSQYIQTITKKPKEGQQDAPDFPGTLPASLP